MPPNIFAQRTLARRQQALESLVSGGVASVTGTIRQIGAGSRSDGSWVVGQLVADDGTTVIPFMGRDLIGCEAGRTVRFEGVWHRHDIYGLQFEVTSVQTRLPTTTAGIARYLGAHVDHLGPTRALKLVATLGPATLDILLDTPERVLGVFPGKTGETLLAGLRRWKETVLSERRFHTGVQQSLDAGAYLGIARRISRHFGANTESILLHHPYRLVEVGGVGFKTADSIARHQGARVDDPARIAAGVVHTLKAALDQGDSALPRGVLLTRAIGELTVEHAEPEASLVDAAICRALEGGAIIDDHDLMYLPEVLALEQEAAERLATLQRVRHPLSDMQRAKVESLLAQADESTDSLTGAQRAAVLTALESGVSILTGRPGAGKTTTVRTVLACTDALGWQVMVAAPSGKAAARAAEVTGKRATTMHVMLGTPPLAVADEPLDCRLVVIDEASMVDLELMVWLLRNMDPARTALFIVGDSDQLPSVSYGRVLGDCIDSAVLPTTALTQIFRQGAGSRIVQNAHRLLDGQPLLTKYEPFTDFIFVDVTQPPTRGDDGFPVDPDTGKRDRQHAEALRRMDRAIAHFLIEQKHADPARDIQVLSPMRIGPLGTEALNEHLQALLNPNGDKGPVIGAKAVVRTGDRVIQTKNNYQVPGYFLNGQQGIVESHGVDWVSIQLDDGRTLRLQGRQLLQLRLAWAITVHRAQGSEFPYVITMYDMSHARMLEKALLYTALTRARKVGIIIGEMEALALTRRRAHRARPRYSALADRLRTAVRTALEATVGAGDDAGVF